MGDLFGMLMRYMLVAILFATPVLGVAAQKADFVLVRKSESKLYLKAGDKTLRVYRVALGTRPKGKKQWVGDERTPEGRYVLDYKKSNSSFYKAIHISYPNESDRKRAAELGVSPGGAIMIHGQPNGLGRLAAVNQMFNWTDGCIAVTNHEMDQIWDAVEPGTPIEIVP